MTNEVRLIDATELKNFFGFMRKMWSASEIIYAINNAETVDAVEVKHGRWVYRSDAPDEDGNLEANCSVCGAGERHNISMVGKVHFCWKCGAKMDGGNDG